jgi:nucleoside 2-deoxyribosyltransferase
MQSPSVYLAGPILGCDKDEANTWRHEVAAKLAAHNIVGISPLRRQLEPSHKGKYGLGTRKTTGSKNIFDVKNCDMTLAYLPKMPEGRHQSYGTLLEIGWAYALGKSVILVTDDPEVRDHMVIDFCANWVTDTLEKGTEIAINILSGYAGGKNV